MNPRQLPVPNKNFHQMTNSF